MCVKRRNHKVAKTSVRGKIIKEQEELEQEELAQLAAPLFDLLQRLVYETTEVALDQPGINLEF